MLSSFGKARMLLSLLCITTIGLISRLSWDLSFFSFNIQNSSVCACHKCLKEGDWWFRERIRAAPQPFLSKTYTPSEADFNWWKRLQLEKRNFVFYKRTLDNLFKIFPPIPDVVKSSPDRCGTCAVVGNSGNLKGSGHGPLIDLHDIVIRMNHGRTKGYEADVGTKTTHHVMYPASAINLDKTTHLVLFPFKINDLLWLLNQFESRDKSAGNSTRIANKDLVMILNPAFIKYVHERWLDNNGYYPSTGFLTLALSLQICDEVSVFGFGADSDGKWGHYFEILKDKRFRTGIHAGGHEFNVIEQLYQRKQINFYKGS